MHFNRSIRFIQLLMTGILLTSCSHTNSIRNKSEVDFFGTQKVHRYELKNGLKVLILEDHSAPTFSYQTWFKVGSKDEQKGLTGLAHLFEHMMFKGTKNLKDGEFDRLLESAGAEGENAFTSNDYTGYVQSLPSDKLELIARLESDRMVNLIVDKDSLNKEREVVQNERRFRNENNPDGMLYEKLYDIAYTKHAYHWPVIGYEADVNGAKPEECDQFYKRFYAPNNATVVIVGDVQPDLAINLIDAYYGKLPSSNIHRTQIEIEPVQTKAVTKIVPIKTQIQKLMMAYHTISEDNDDLTALEVLKTVLSTGKTSRLNKRLVDSGIASEISIDNEEREHPGLFVFFANLQKNKSASQAAAIIENELKQIEQGKTTAHELARAASLYKLTLFDGLASPANKAHFLGFYETVGKRFERGIEISKKISKITSKDLARVVKKYFKKTNKVEIIGLSNGGASK